jgi:molybdate transport system ATP-binding protein
MVRIEKVSVVKAGRQLFENFSWTISPHEHWIINGANGSGKTSLLEVIAGVLHASQGEIHYSFIDGLTWDERYTKRKQSIHYIPAHAASAFLSNAEIFYQQRYYSIGDERTPSTREFFGENTERLHAFNFPPSFFIDELLDLPVTRLSNGQLKKVLILQNLVLNIPKMLLLDYPFEGLDHQSRKDFIQFLDHLAVHDNVQLIIVDHHHHLPSVINRRLELAGFGIESIDDVTPSLVSFPSVIHEIPARKNTETLVEMEEVTIRYGRKEIISKLNWTIRKGERWALTGRNGSGKTTLFSMIYADHPMAYSQKVYLFGKRRGSGESIWDVKKRINYLGPELLSYLNPKSLSDTGYEYILQQQKNINRRKVDEIIQFFNAQDFINRPVRIFSSGQLQLLMVMNSLLSDKELLLLDEPFQFLDPVLKAKLIQFLHEHLFTDTTLVLITHYEEDIREWTQLRMEIR